MYQFRPFRNFDPPRLAEIWRSQPPQRGVMQPMSASLLEQFVFSKPYFDREGLTVAVHDGQVIGFSHASFGPNEGLDAISTDIGTTQLLMLRSDHRDQGLADELLVHSEAYLRDRGAKVIYAGGVRPLNAFYLGLYGGSELCGVLAGDEMFAEACRRGNYRQIDSVVVVHRELSRFRAPISRDQRRLRRETSYNERYCPRPVSWWEACTTAVFERLHFRVQRSDIAAAEVWFWDIEPLSTGWGVPTAGMFDLYVQPEFRRQGYATFVLSESFTRLRNRGIVLIEAQTMAENKSALAMYEKLGFDRVDQGFVFRKE